MYKAQLPSSGMKRRKKTAVSQLCKKKRLEGIAMKTVYRKNTENEAILDLNVV